MTAEIKLRRCYGCGTTLQSLDRYEPGYVSPARSKNDEGLCDRCFKLRNPGDTSSQTITPAYSHMIEKGLADHALFCYVLDAFSLDSSAVPSLSSMIAKGRVVALINKVDLLPSNVSVAELKEGVNFRLKMQGIDPVGIYMTSMDDDSAMAHLRDFLDEKRDGTDVYLIGSLRVGKSTLVNNFLKFYTNSTDRAITRENLGTPDDELIVTAIPLDGSSTLYDTPGVFLSSSLANQIDRRTLKYILPRTKVANRPFKLKPNEGLALGGLSFLLQTAGPRDQIEFYFSSDVEIKRIPAVHAGDEFTALVQNSKIYPISQTIRDADALESKHIEVPADNQEHVISIVGFGRLRLVGAGQSFDFFVPKGVDVIFYQ